MEPQRSRAPNIEAWRLFHDAPDRDEAVAQLQELARRILPLPGNPVRQLIEEMFPEDSRTMLDLRECVDDVHAPAREPRIADDLDRYLAFLAGFVAVFEEVPPIREQPMRHVTVVGPDNPDPEDEPGFWPADMEEALEEIHRWSERYRREREAIYGPYPEAPDVQ